MPDEEPFNRKGSGRSVDDIPKEALAPNIIFVLHGCSTAAGDDSFAKSLLKEILGGKPKAKVYGHYDLDACGQFYRWRVFSSKHPEGKKRKTIPFHRPPPSKKNKIEALFC